jgi:AraC-like DNA-binding protein/quercetin dioxygenase-like cupin family protein
MDKKMSDANYLKWPAEPDSSIKVMCWEGDYTIESHKHEYIEIAFMAGGTCSHSYLGSEVRLMPGDLFVITPHEEHAYEINSKTVIYNCLFYPEALGEDWTKLKENKNIYDLLIVEPFYRTEIGRQEILHLTPSDAYRIEALLKRMIEEQENRQENFELIQKSNLVIFLCYMGRIWKNQLMESSKAYRGKRDMLAEAITYIEGNIGDQISIDTLASKIYVSPSYFRKLFKKVTGQSPIDYINEIRISKAKQLLLEENRTVAEIAEMVGITDHNYFSKLFKAATGCSPTEYKKRSELY